MDSSLKYIVGFDGYFGKTINNNATQNWMNQNSQNQISKSYSGAEIFGAVLIINYLVGLTFGVNQKGKDEFGIRYPVAISLGKMKLLKLMISALIPIRQIYY